MTATGTSTGTTTGLQAARTAAEAFLRRVLVLDAAACAVMGSGLLAAAGPLADPSGMSSGLLRGAGAVLVPCAVVIAFVATRRPLHRGGVAAVVLLNLAWVAASVALALGAWGGVSTLGAVVTVAQALAVLGFAAVETVGLRRLGSRPAP